MSQLAKRLFNNLEMIRLLLYHSVVQSTSILRAVYPKILLTSTTTISGMHLDSEGFYCQTATWWKYETGHPSNSPTVSAHQSLFELTFKPSPSIAGYIMPTDTTSISIWQPAITVAWERWDLSRFTPASAPILEKPQTWHSSTFPTASSPWASSTSGQLAPSSSLAPVAFAENSTFQQSSSSLSVGAQAGIGLGVSVAVLAITGVLAWVFFWRRRRSAAEPRSASIRRARQGEAKWVWFSSPVLMVGSLVAAVFLALGHHLFYASLAGTNAPTGSYRIAGSVIPKQRFNTAVGTAFAFLVKAALTVTIGIAYTQVYCRSAKTARKGQRLSTMDATYSVMTNIFEFVRVQVEIIPATAQWWPTISHSLISRMLRC